MNPPFISETLVCVLGTTALFETVKATAKTAVVGLAAFFAIYPRLTELASLTGDTTKEYAATLTVGVAL